MIWLGKSGKIFGPYSEKQYEALQTEGRLSDYTWIWDEKKQAWSPLETPPPPPVLKSSSRKGSTPEHWEVVCHNFKDAFSGRITSFHEQGGVILSTHESLMPVLSEKSKIYLNLLETKSGKSLCVQATLRSVQRTRQGWSYQVEWESAPDFAA